MHFDPALLETYRTLLQTTDLQRAYQEFIRLFRFLRTELERQMPDFRFQGGITENAMDYAYFSFTDPDLKEKRLKLVVAFQYQRFQLEVWLSGVNRAAQLRWVEHWRDCPPPMELTPDPNHTDFVVRLPVEAELSDGEKLAAAVKETANRLLRIIP